MKKGVAKKGMQWLSTRNRAVILLPARLACDVLWHRFLRWEEIEAEEIEAGTPYNMKWKQLNYRKSEQEALGNRVLSPSKQCPLRPWASNKCTAKIADQMGRCWWQEIHEGCGS